MPRTAIETYSGLVFDYAAPQADQVNVEDIAQALSITARFGGHIKHAYSVAQHSLHVRQLVLHAGHPELGYAALHHDSHEAYTGDAPKPFKNAMGAEFFDAYKAVAARVNLAVAEHLGINPDEFCHPVIKEADDTALRMEAAALKVNDGRTFAEVCGVDPLEPSPGVGAYFPPEEIRETFLIAHRQEAGCLVS